MLTGNHCYLQVFLQRGFSFTLEIILDVLSPLVLTKATFRLPVTIVTRRDRIVETLYHLHSPKEFLLYRVQNPQSNQKEKCKSIELYESHGDQDRKERCEVHSMYTFIIQIHNKLNTSRIITCGTKREASPEDIL